MKVKYCLKILVALRLRVKNKIMPHTKTPRQEGYGRKGNRKYFLKIFVASCENKKMNISQIADKFGLDIVYAFGSQAKAVAGWINGEISALTISSSSDVDIGVKPRPGKNLTIKEKVHLSMAFEDLFTISRVDLVVIPEADPFLAANIIRGERIFCRDEYTADGYDLYILRRAGDLAPLERERIALIMGTD